MSRRLITTGLVLAVLAAGGWGAWRYLAARPAAVPSATPAASATVEAGIELATTDLTTATTIDLTQGLPLTGSLRAVNSALVKARVAGELQGLSVREGDAVQQGQEIARIDATEAQARLAQAREQADAARTQVEIAQRQFDNNKALVDQGFISRTALETSQSSLAGAQATHKAALAAVDVARKTLEDTVLRAPIAGVVSQRLAQPGERLSIDGRVVEIVDPRRLELEASVGVSDSVRVRVGQTASLSIEGLPRPVKATITRINPTAQAGTRSVPVYLAVEAAPGLRQGLFAQGLIQTGRVRAVAVPLGALRTDKPQPYLQMVEGERIVHRSVTPGARGEREGVELAAVDGIADGSQVLLGHVGPLREGTRVRFTRNAPAAPGQSGASAAARPAS